MSAAPASSDALTLAQAKELLRCLAGEESLLLLSSPGIGKSDLVRQAAAEAGLVCRELLGTQIAPEDVSGVPKLSGARTVFCPPRQLLPADDRPCCIFLDDLPAAPADVQKAFYALLLERRLGEFSLPKGSWVVAAGNRAEDRAALTPLSRALINRVFILNIRVDVAGWQDWARQAGVRQDIRAFIQYVPQALCRPVPREPVPFSTPRSWTLLSSDLNHAETGGILHAEERRALAFGRLSPEDASLFCALAEDGLDELLPIRDYLHDPGRFPKQMTAGWFVVHRLRQAVERGELRRADDGEDFPRQVNALLAALPQELRFASLLDLVPEWADHGATESMLETLKEVTGL
jgi:hypothetical protein